MNGLLRQPLFATYGFDVVSFFQQSHGGRKMKSSFILAILFIGGIVYYVTGGGAMMGLGRSTPLPETSVAPNATFMGDEQENPFFHD